MTDFPNAPRGAADPDIDDEFLAEQLFAEPFIGLVAVIGWVAHRNADKAREIGFWRFCDIAAKDTLLFEAKDKLWRALQTGALKAIGATSEGWVEIPPLEWCGLEFTPAAVDGVASWQGPARHYTAVRVDRPALLELWPAAPTDAGTEPRKRGRKPAKRDSVAAAMRQAAASGYDLGNATDKELEAKFGAGRSVVRAASAFVLSEMNSGQLKTKNN